MAPTRRMGQSALNREKPMSLLKAALFALTALLAMPAIAGEPTKVAIHVDENDPARMNMALNNAANVRKYYEDKGEEVVIRVVAYGPGLHMLRADTSPVRDRIEKMSLEMPNLSFAACGNTHRAMSAKMGEDVALVDEAEMVSSGVVELIELQKKGWAYIRP